MSNSRSARAPSQPRVPKARSPGTRRPRLTISQILGWADAHRARTGAWPSRNAGKVFGRSAEIWRNVDAALIMGLRGLPGYQSLAQLLAARRGKRNPRCLEPLDDDQILSWADAHHARTGRWPQAASGPIPEALGEDWCGVNAALSAGARGLPRGSSLRRLLVTHRNASFPRPRRVCYTEEQILGWVDAFFARNDRWPSVGSGTVPECGKSWNSINSALQLGTGGLSGGDSLSRFIARHRGKRSEYKKPLLTIPQILGWADAHHARTGEWPPCRSGSIQEALSESWAAIDAALAYGLRGLCGGQSLAQLLSAHRGARNQSRLTPLTIVQILAWADAWYARTGNWPRSSSGSVPDAPGETWSGIGAALSKGGRGLPGGSSLARLLARERRTKRPSPSTARPA